MMAPGCTAVPSNTFTPRRLAAESRPLRVEPPPLVLDMSSSAPRDAGDLDHGVVLPVTPVAALVRLVLVGEALDLGTLGLAHHPGRHGGAGQVGGLGDDGVAIDQQHGREGQLAVSGQLLNLHAVALGYPLLLPTRTDHCVHRRSMLSEAPPTYELCAEAGAMTPAFAHSSAGLVSQQTFVHHQ